MSLLYYSLTLTSTVAPFSTLFSGYFVVDSVTSVIQNLYDYSQPVSGGYVDVLYPSQSQYQLVSTGGALNDNIFDTVNNIFTTYGVAFNATVQGISFTNQTIANVSNTDVSISTSVHQNNILVGWQFYNAGTVWGNTSVQRSPSIALSSDGTQIVAMQRNNDFGAIVYSNDSGSTFQSIYTAATVNSRCGGVAMSYDGTRLYFGGSGLTPNKGIFSSVVTSGTPSTPGLTATTNAVNCVSCDSSGEYVIASGTSANKTLYYSSDHGSSFVDLFAASTNLPNTTYRFCKATAASGASCLSFLANGASGGLYKTIIGSTTTTPYVWTLYPFPATASSNYSYATSDDLQQYVIAINSLTTTSPTTYFVYTSQDGGSNWRTIQTTQTSTALTYASSSISPTGQFQFYSLYWNTSPTQTCESWYSTDYGVTFYPVNFGSTSMFITGAALQPNATASSIQLLATDKRSATTITTQMTSTNNSTVYIETINIPDPSCYEENTRIKAKKGENGKEEFICIKNLCVGDFVKTWRHGYRPIQYIGYNEMINDPTFFNMTMYTHTRFPNLKITGGHSLLFSQDQVEQMSSRVVELNEELFAKTSKPPNVDDKTFVIAAALAEAGEFVADTCKGTKYKYFHFALSPDALSPLGNENQRYAVYVENDEILSESLSVVQFEQGKYKTN